MPDAVLDDLRERLARTRLPDQLEDVGWDYGAELGYVTDLITYWRDEFDWRAAERRLNALDHYKTVIDGLDIHFIHQRSPVEDALPLIITHGWPGSVAEFLKVIGPLTESRGARRRPGRRLPRRRAVDARLRLLGQAAGSPASARNRSPT